MDTAVHFSSDRDDWETPPETFANLDATFHFDIDVCATAENTKCRKFYTPEDNGLLMPWAPLVCWMNPPYGHVIKDWVAKAHREAGCGATVVGLLPSRTDTTWFHSHIYNGHAEIEFIKGRLRFWLDGKKGGSAPFPSMIVVWKPIDNGDE